MFVYKNIILIILLFLQYICDSKQQSDGISPLPYYKYYKDFREDDYSLEFSQSLNIFNGTIAALFVEKIHAVQGFNSCLGLTTPSNETILLKCPELQPEETDCLKIIIWQTESKHDILTPREEIGNVCAKHVKPHYLGFTTPNGWILLYDGPRNRVIKKLIRMPYNMPKRM